MIPGLQYYPSYLTSAQETNLLEELDHNPWVKLGTRRVQYYGYRYDVRARSSEGLYIGPLPPWLDSLARELQPALGDIPDAVLVNEYLPGVGIGAHVDDTWSFSSKIAILSLGSGIQMDFQHVQTKETESLYLSPVSLLLMTRDSRFLWTHGIEPRLSDIVNGEERPRSRRISVTLRKIIY